MKKKLSVIGIALLLAVLLSMPAMAANVCKIGSKGYPSLQAAVDAVKNGQTIKVTKAIKTTERVETGLTKANKYTIDFAKKKYTYKGDGAALGIAQGKQITVKNLNMTGSTMFDVGGMITITGGKATCDQLAVVSPHHTNGELVIKGGTYKTNSTNRADLLIWNYGKLTISKGTLKQAKSEDPGRPTIHNEGTLVLKGGKIESCAGGIHSTGGSIKVTGGTIEIKRVNNANNNPAIWTSNTKVNIKKGTFTVPDDLTVIDVSDHSDLTISGGTFKSGWKVNSHAVIADGEGTIAKLNGGVFDGGVIDCRNSANMILNGGKGNKIIVALQNGSVTINDFTIDQKDQPWDAMLILEGNGKSMVVNGGKFISKQGFGYRGNVTFKVKNYKKLFDVKTLKR